MVKKSAGILLYRIKPLLEVFLVHPGGPYFARKDAGTWTIPKGEFVEPESPLDAAMREFKEETSIELNLPGLELMPVKQKSGKVVYAWAIEGDLDYLKIRSNTFSLEWPVGSGIYKEFPEIDRGGWFEYIVAKEKIIKAQLSFIDELVSILNKNKKSKVL